MPLVEASSFAHHDWLASRRSCAALVTTLFSIAIGFIVRTDARRGPQAAIQSGLKISPPSSSASCDAWQTTRPRMSIGAFVSLLNASLSWPLV